MSRCDYDPDNILGRRERNEYRLDHFRESYKAMYASGQDQSWVDYLGTDRHEELIQVLQRHWKKLERCGLSPSLGGGYDDILVRRDAVEAIDIAWEAAIDEAIDNQIARGEADNYDPDENPHD